MTPHLEYDEGSTKKIFKYFSLVMNAFRENRSIKHSRCVVVGAGGVAV